MLSSGFESWKMIALLVHLALSIGFDGKVVPSTPALLERLGITDSTINNVSDVISSACATCIEMHKALDAKSMKYDDHRRILYLIAIAKYHHVRLNVLKRVLSMVRARSIPTPEQIASLYQTALAGNKIHHSMIISLTVQFNAKTN